MGLDNVYKANGKVNVKKYVHFWIVSALVAKWLLEIIGNGRN